MPGFTHQKFSCFIDSLLIALFEPTFHQDAMDVWLLNIHGGTKEQMTMRFLLASTVDMFRNAKENSVLYIPSFLLDKLGIFNGNEAQSVVDFFHYLLTLLGIPNIIHLCNKSITIPYRENSTHESIQNQYDKNPSIGELTTNTQQTRTLLCHCDASSNKHIFIVDSLYPSITTYTSHEDGQKKQRLERLHLMDPLPSILIFEVSRKYHSKSALKPNTKSCYIDYGIPYGQEWILTIPQVNIYQWKLQSVICIRQGHYVAFIRVQVTKESFKWMYYDDMNKTYIPLSSSSLLSPCKRSSASLHGELFIYERVM